MDIKLNKENGITLIALVVTIVVLLILAGVSISMLTGENGIIRQAQNSKEETRGGAVEEARDLWRADKQTDKLTNSNTAQTLDELLDDLVEEKLLSEEEKEEIKETGKVTIGSRTIDFDLPKKLDVYTSIRAVPQYVNGERVYETKIIYEIKVPVELIIGMTNEEIVQLNEKLQEIVNEENDNMTTDEKEQIFNQMIYFLIRIMPDISGMEDVTLEDVIEMMANEMGVTEECKTIEQLYNAIKNSNIEDNSIKNMTYDEFLYSLIKSYAPMFIQITEALKTRDEAIEGMLSKEIQFQYTITKPDGTKIVENITVNPQSEYRGLWFAIEIPVEEYGEYNMIIKSLETEYEGTADIEYINNRYLVTWENGGYARLYDTQLKEIVDIDELYMYINGERTDIKDRIVESTRGQGIELYRLREKNTPYEIEFVKNGEKVKIPVLIVAEVS